MIEDQTSNSVPSSFQSLNRRGVQKSRPSLLQLLHVCCGSAFCAFVDVHLAVRFRCYGLHELEYMRVRKEIGRTRRNDRVHQIATGSAQSSALRSSAHAFSESTCSEGFRCNVAVLLFLARVRAQGAKLFTNQLKPLSWPTSSTWCLSHLQDSQQLHEKGQTGPCCPVSGIFNSTT